MLFARFFWREYTFAVSRHRFCSTDQSGQKGDTHITNYKSYKQHRIIQNHYKTQLRLFDLYILTQLMYQPAQPSQVPYLLMSVRSLRLPYCPPSESVPLFTDHLTSSLLNHSPSSHDTFPVYLPQVTSQPLLLFILPTIPFPSSHCPSSASTQVCNQ
jgi:hypothetical protein